MYLLLNRGASKESGLQNSCRLRQGWSSHEWADADHVIDLLHYPIQEVCIYMDRMR